MKLVQNTTDIPDTEVERILKEVEAGGDLSVAVMVRNCWKGNYFAGTFHHNYNGFIRIAKGQVRRSPGAEKWGCNHMITLRLPVVGPWLDMKLHKIHPGGGILVIHIPTREAGLQLLAAHEFEHVRTQEGRIPQSEMVCDLVMLHEAEEMGLEVTKEEYPKPPISEHATYAAYVEAKED